MPAAIEPFYVAARAAAGQGGGIHRFHWTDGDGGPVPVAAGVTPLDQCTWIAFSPDGRVLYATCAVDGSGGVAAFAMDASPAGHAPRPLGVCAAGGAATCHLAVAPTGRWLFAANYSGGNVAVFRLRGDGGVAERVQLIAHAGHGPDASRQEGPHPHYTGISPDGRFLCVVDLGIDRIVAYPLDDARGIDPDARIESAVTAPGAGPRHLAFAADGRIAYLVNELANTAQSLAYADGRFAPIAEAPLLPPNVNVYSKAAAARLSPDGHFLYATNRGFDSVAAFRLDGAGGLAPVGLWFSGGDGPRDAAALPAPAGDLFASANEFSDRLTLFRRDAATGALAPHGAVFTLPHPLCIAHA